VLCLIGPWRARTQSAGLRRITNTSEEGININPSISGDGRTIAFETTEDLAGAGGSDHFRAIRANVGIDPPTFFQMAGTRAVTPAISQDGSRIAFASRDDPLGTNTDGNSEIFLFDGAKLIQITRTSPGNLANRITNGNFQPSISDDGRFIAFSSNRDLVAQNSDGNLEIFVFDTLATTFTQLTNSSGIVGSSDAKISGNGATVAYIRDPGTTPSTRRDLLEQSRADPGPVTVLVTNMQSLAMTSGRAISDDGTRVVFSAETAANSSQVFLFDGRGDASIRQVTSLGVRTTEVPPHPTISGDGSRIAFEARRNVIGGNSDGSVELYVFDIPSSQMSKITSAPSSATAEIVSSLNDDGSIVAFNFPRVLSGAVSNSDLANDSEIYVTETPARPAFGTLTVLNGASFGKEPSATEAIAPDSIAVARGGNLANTTQQSQRLPNGRFPTNVGGTTVTVNGRGAQIFFVSPGQVNFLVPPETEIGTANVVVTNSEGFPSRTSVPTLRGAPGVFTTTGDGTGDGVILNGDSLQEGPFDPSSGNLRLTIFATGARNATQNLVVIGGRVINAEAVIASPDMAGLDEVHVLVPRDLRGAGTIDLFVQSDGRASNSASLTFTGDAARDIVVNEVLSDPPGAGPTDLQGDANHDNKRDSSEDEFIELVNTTSHDIDISGYQLLTRSSSATTDTVRHTFATRTILPACSAIVVFGGGNFDPANSLFGGAQVVKSASALSLSNSGGTITLRDQTNVIITSLPYGGSTNLNGNASQSLTRSPDISGSFVLHQSVSGKLFSPGTRVDGTPFNACPPVTRVDVSPSSAAIETGAKQQFTAKAFDAGGNEVSGVIFSWQSSNTSVAAIDFQGLANGVAGGTTQIIASGRGATSTPATLTIATPLPTPTPLVVISQVYGGGGNSGASLKNDFIEVFNRGDTSVNIAGWSVQQASASGSIWSVTPLCPSGACTLAAGQYFLVQEASSGANGAALPTPDATGTLNLGATDGKTALLNSTTPLSGTDCSSWKAKAVDLVGYGSATCFEGLGATASPSNGKSVLRNKSGCTDTNNNGADFATANPGPRNSGSPLSVCSNATPTPTATPSPTPTPTPNPPQVTRVDVSSLTSTINRGNTQQFTATALDAANQVVPGASFIWTSSNPAIATVNSSGLATGAGIGTVTITATTGNGAGGTVSGTAAINVQIPLTINEILADPPGSVTTDLAGDSNRDGVRDGDDDEFVEVLNNSNAPVDVSGVIVADGTSNRFTFPANTTLAAGRAVVIFGGGSPPLNDPAFGGALIVKASSLGLGNTSDTVTVKLPLSGTEVVIATQTYGAEGGNNQSLTRSPDAEVSSSGGSFVTHSTSMNAAGRLFSPGTRADGTPFGSPAITRIEITPASIAKDIGGTQTFTAHAFSNLGGPEIEVPNVCFIWDSSANSKATVVPLTGQSTNATALAPGSSMIGARAGGHQGAATFTINTPPPVLTRVTISPTSATDAVGDTQQFTGQALDQFGQPIGSVTISFASSNTTIATIESVSATSGTGSATATVTGDATGSAEIRTIASNGSTSVTSSPATLTVEPAAGQLLISEFRTRGPGGAADEFVEIYNPTTSTLVIGGLKIRGSNNAGTVSDRVTITAGTTLGSGCHYLIANSTAGTGYSGATPPNQTYTTGLTDDGGIAITGSNINRIIDAVGMGTGSAYKEGSTLTPLAGTANQSYERKPGGASGNGTDTNNNANDFYLNSGSSNPQNSSSGCLDTAPADLSLTKTVNDSAPNIGQALTFTITLNNAGPNAATGVQVKDVLPAGLSFISATPSQGSYNNANGIWTIGTVNASSSAALTINATVQTASTITNTAEVTASDQVDPDSTPNNHIAGEDDQCSVTINQPRADLSITKTDSPDPVPSGNTLTYTLAVTSSGPNAAQSVVVTDNLPGNLTFVSCSATGIGVCGGTGNNRTVTFSSLANGTTETITLVATVNSSVSGGATILNTAAVTSSTFDPTPSNNSISQTTSVNTVIINEVLISFASGTGRAKFLELYNTTAQPRDISGMVISFRPGGSGNTPGAITLPGAIGSNTTVVGPNEYFLVVNGASTFGVNADYNAGTSLDLNGTGGGIKIELDGVKLDGFTYQGSAAAINATFVAYGEGSIFTFTAATTSDLVRSSTSSDTNNNLSDFRLLSSTGTVTPKAANPP
jgi:uncharacterized protein (TIGR03437 family)